MATLDMHTQHQEARDRLDFLLFVGLIGSDLARWFHAVMDGLVDAADAERIEYIQKSNGPDLMTGTVDQP